MEESNGFGYFLLGLGLGVAAGVLLAPQSGAETRDFLKSKADDSTDYLKARADDSREYLKTRADESREYVKRRTNEVVDSANDLIDRSKTAVARSKDNVNAAVEAGKQAYRDAITNFENSTVPGKEGV